MSKYWPVIAAVCVAVVLTLAVVAMGRPGPVRITVTLTDYRIEASHTWVRKGDTVTLTVTNRGREIHELEVEGYDKELEDITPGETRSLTFRAERSGPIELVCHFADHYAKGMRTTIQVVDSN